MKKLGVLLVIILLATIGLAQSNVPKANVDAIEVSPPSFMGVKVATLPNVENSDALIRDFLQKNVVFPSSAILGRREGTEVVQFDITANGDITNFKVINSVCPEIDGEVIRALKKTKGMWKPGYNDHTPVTMTKEISMPFVLQRVPNWNYDKAKEYFTSVAQRHFTNGVTKMYMEGNFRKALRDFNRAFKYTPNDAGLLMNRGLCLYQLGDKESARDDWERMACFSPQLANLKLGADNMEGYAELVQLFEK